MIDGRPCVVARPREDNPVVRLRRGQGLFLEGATENKERWSSVAVVWSDDGGRGRANLIDGMIVDRDPARRNESVGVSLRSGEKFERFRGMYGGGTPFLRKFGR